MLGGRGPQRGLFEADTMYLDFVGGNTFYAYLARHRGEIFRDEDFAALYHPAMGRPSVPPSLLATALVLQTYDRVSDDEAKRRAAYDLQWKVALGIELDVRPFTKSTLQEFRAQLIVHQEEEALFKRSLELAKRQGYFKGKKKLKIALDTTHILGHGAVKDTYNLLADGILRVMEQLATLADEPVEGWAEREGFAHYVSGSSVKGEADVDWGDSKARRRFLQEIVADADRLLELVRTTRGRLDPNDAADQALVQAAGVLSRVLVQDVERKEDGPDLKQGVEKDRLLSVHDPEMRHGRKSKRRRFDGHKAQVAVDTDSQIITAVKVLPGNAPDRELALEHRPNRRHRSRLRRLCLRRRGDAPALSRCGSEAGGQGPGAHQPGILPQDPVPHQSRGGDVYLPGRADHPEPTAEQERRWDLSFPHRGVCAVSAA